MVTMLVERTMVNFLLLGNTDTVGHISRVTGSDFEYLKEKSTSR